MVQQPAHSIIAELEDAVRGGSSAKRVETLRQVTDLFLNDGERLSDDQVKVFDDVLCLLIARVETRAKAELCNGWRRSTTRRSKSSSISPGTTRSRSPARCSPIPAGSGPRCWSRSPARRGRITCSPFPAGPTFPRPSPTSSSIAAKAEVIRKLANNAGAGFPRPGLFRHRRARRRGRRTGRNPRPSPDFPASLSRPAAPRQGNGSRPAVGDRAARIAGRDQTGVERDRPRGDRPRRGVSASPRNS